jgi:threonine aldolase
MWEAMRNAPTGSASLGEDENVLALERRGARLLGKEAALFVPTCTMANLAALLTQGMPGQSVVVERAAHVMTSESLGVTEVARLVPFAVDAERGRLDPAAVERAFRRSGAALLCLENTQTRAGGTVTDVALTEALVAAARRHGARVHLDGARLPNAAATLGVPLAALAAPVDTVSMSLNKGLCAPFGALLAGDAATIAAARPHVHRLGGGSIHKAGILAAAGLLALDLVERLADDHRRARTLAARLDLEEPETNIVLTGIPAASLPALREQGVLAFAPDGAHVRLVTHRGVADADLDRAAASIAAVARG